MNNVLMVSAHPDDEIIFGWPFLQMEAKKTIICLSSDEHNQSRQWCKDRKLALKEVSDMLGIKCICLHNNSEFYKYNERNGELSSFMYNALDAIQKELPVDAIFTHNPIGEYGHLDHILTHQICMSIKRGDIMFTDMFAQTCWTPYENIPSRFDIYYKNKVSKDTLDIDLYNRCKTIYQKHNSWTWDKEPINECSIFKI